MSKFSESGDYSGDSKYKQYAADVEKALKNFEYTTEWADLIRALGKLHKVLQSHSKSYHKIPHAVRVSKRLSQCMHPALPFGVHLKAIECYRQIFDCLGTTLLGGEIHLYSVGLFPLLPNATINVKKALLDLYEKYFVSLGVFLQPALSGFLNGVLPALEEGSEFFDRTHNLLNQIASSVDRRYFFTRLWQCVALNPAVRLPALLYASSSFDRRKSLDDQLHLVGSDIAATVEGLRASADDSTVLVQRQLLDFLNSALPLDSQRLPKADFRRLLKSCLFIVLRRDMSLNRRLYGWMFGCGNNGRSAASESADSSADAYYGTYAEPLIVEGMLEILNGEDGCRNEQLIRLLRLFLYLTDRVECARTVNDRLLLPVLYKVVDAADSEEAVDKEKASSVSSGGNKTSAAANATVEDVLKVLNLLLGGHCAGYLWEFLDERFSFILKQQPTDVQRFCRLIRFLLNVSAQLPHSTGTNVHMTKLMETIFVQVSTTDQPLGVYGETCAVASLLLGALEKCAPTTGPGPSPPSDFEETDASSDWSDARADNASASWCRSKGLVFCAVVARRLKMADRKTKLSIAQRLCELLKALSDFPIYFFETPGCSLHQLKSQACDCEWLDAVSKLCLTEDSAVSNHCVDALLYVYALSKSILKEHYAVEASVTDKVSRRPSFATKVLLMPVLSNSSVALLESSNFFQKLSRLLWNWVNQSENIETAARLLLYLHSVEESGGSSCCEDLIVNEMTSADERVRANSLENFFRLWVLWRRYWHECFLPGYPPRSFERAVIAMLNYVNGNSGACSFIASRWLDDALERNDAFEVTKVMISVLAHPSSARVSVQSLVFRRSARDQDLTKLATSSGLSLFHYRKRAANGACFTKLRKSLYLSDFSPAENSEEPAVKRDVIASVGEFDNLERVVEKQHEIAASDWTKNVDGDVARIVASVLNELVDSVVESLSSDDDSFKYPSLSEDHSLSAEMANVSPVFERYTPDSETLDGGEVANEAAEFFAASYGDFTADDAVSSNDSKNDKSAACNPLAFHAHLLLYCAPFEASRVAYAFRSLKNILKYSPRLAGQILTSSLRSASATSISSTEEVELLLAKHARSILGLDFFAHSSSDDSRKLAKALNGTFLETLLTLSLYYLRSLYANSPLAPISSADVEANWAAKSECLAFLLEVCKVLNRCTDDKGQAFACYVADVMASCRFQKCLLHLVMATLTDEKLLSRRSAFNGTEQNESVSSSIVRFNM